MRIRYTVLSIGLAFVVGIKDVECNEEHSVFADKANFPPGGVEDMSAVLVKGDYAVARD